MNFSDANNFTLEKSVRNDGSSTNISSRKNISVPIKKKKLICIRGLCLAPNLDFKSYFTLLR